MSDKQEHKDGQMLPEQQPEPTKSIFRRNATKIIVVLFVGLGYFLVSQISYQWNDVFDGYYSYVGKNSNGVKNPLLIDSLEYSWELWPYSSDQNDNPVLLDRQCSVEVYNLDTTLVNLSSLDDVQKYLNTAYGNKKSVVYYKKASDYDYVVSGEWFRNSDQPEKYYYNQGLNKELNINAIFESVDRCLSYFNTHEDRYSVNFLRKRIYPFFKIYDTQKKYVDIIKNEKTLIRFYARCYQSIVNYYNYDLGVMVVVSADFPSDISICPSLNSRR